MTDRVKEKLVEFLCEAHNKITDECCMGGKDMSYAEEVAMEADCLIANGVTVQEQSGNSGQFKWIPVKERLPEDTEMVLICSQIGNQYVAQHYRGHFYSDGTRISTSHWMPLPQPPKGD